MPRGRSHSAVPMSTDDADDADAAVCAAKDAVAAAAAADDATNAADGLPRFVYLLAAFAALNSVNLGYDIGVNSGVGYHLQAAGEGMALSDGELEGFYGVFGGAAVVGAAAAYALSDGLGRRGAFAATAVAFIAGVVWTASAADYGSLLCGRALTGAGVGLGLAIDPVYIAEVSPPSHRGRLVTWSETATNVGILLGFVGGFFFRDSGEAGWRTMVAKPRGILSRFNRGKKRSILDEILFRILETKPPSPAVGRSCSARSRR